MTDNGKTEHNDNASVFDDSDIMMIEPHISVVILDDSDEETPINDQDDGEIKEQENVPNDISRTENGNNDSGKILFEINFLNSGKYCELKDLVQESLKTSLKNENISIKFTENDKFFHLTGFECEEKSPEDAGNDENVDTLFQIDTTPAKISTKNVPSYKRSVKKILNDEQKASENNEAKRIRPSKTCFNCAGDHNLIDCPEPRNQQRVNKARKQHGSSNQRYHIDIEQRFAHLRPGALSAGLRKALGITKKQLPSFIYKMRLLGYPPGWIEEARVANSGLTLFDSAGRQVLASDEEDGEDDDEKNKFDVRKIISYPGFNVEPRTKYYDDAKLYNAPPMLPEFSKENLIRSLQGNIGTGSDNCKILKNFEANSGENSRTGSIETADMEIEAETEILKLENPPLPSTEPLPPGDESIPLPPPKTPSPVPKYEVNISRSSPSLETLQERQKRLLEQLQNSSAQESVPDDSLIDEIIALDSTIENSQSSDDERSSSNKNGSDESNSVTKVSSSLQLSEAPNNVQESELASKNAMSGTPILKFSPYGNLPSGEEFSKGVTDMINFENLPDSTGKYDQMKHVIHKVRKLVTKLTEKAD